MQMKKMNITNVLLNVPQLALLTLLVAMNIVHKIVNILIFMRQNFWMHCQFKVCEKVKDKEWMKICFKRCGNLAPAP
ncbi:hypothetical protein P3S67_016402 [Capsicum chacoense]